MEKIRDFRNLPWFESFKCAMENNEECVTHVWVTKIVKINEGMCACARHTIKKTICRYCGTDRDMITAMERLLAQHNLAHCHPFPKNARVGGLMYDIP